MSRHYGGTVSSGTGLQPVLAMLDHGILSRNSRGLEARATGNVIARTRRNALLA
jgi:hypothetical protein